MSLMKRGGVYWSYFYIDGVRHQESTGTPNRRRARQIEEKLMEDANLKRFQIHNYQPDMSFKELAAYFIANAKVRPHHVERLNMLLPYFGETAIGQIDKGLVNQYRQARHKLKKITDATVNRDIEVLRHILYWAVDDGHYLTANPIARMRLERERKKRRTVLSVEHEAKLLAAASAHLKPIITLALDTGMRRGELLNQVWTDVDFTRKVLYVSKSKTPGGEAREIPLSKRVLQLLSNLRKDAGPVFTFHKQPIRAVKTSWKTALTKSGIPRLRFHDLRHSFATRLMEAGVNRETRKALMGHSSGDDVHDGYLHVELPLKREAIAQLERWLEQQIQSVGGTNDTTETIDNEDARPDEPEQETLAQENHR